MKEQWQEDLDWLLAGPFTGRGGIVALAKELLVTPHAIHHWRSGRRAPYRAGQVKLRFVCHQYRKKPEYSEGVTS